MHAVRRVCATAAAAICDSVLALFRRIFSSLSPCLSLESTITATEIMYSYSQHGETLPRCAQAFPQFLCHSPAQSTLPALYLITLCLSLLQAALAMLPLDPPPPSPPSGGTAAETWDFEATPVVGLALRAESLVLSSCRLWCPPRPWSLLRGGGARGHLGGGFLHRVSAHALACPANHVSGVRLLAALLPHESPAPLHRLVLPVATAAAAAAGVAAAATTVGGADVSGGTDNLGRLVGGVHTAAALECSEGLRRQAVVALESRVGEVLRGWDVCIAGDVCHARRAGSAAARSVNGNGGTSDEKESAPGGDDAVDEASDNGDSGEDGDRWGGGAGWRPELTSNPLLAVTAPEAVNVPAVVVSLCHTASPPLQRRVQELAKRWVHSTAK